jgi:F-type H+-transporting ATPase subunit delta
LNNILIKFLSFLIFKKRFFYVEKILSDFIETCSKKRGEIKAQLIAAKNLTDIEINDIKNELAKNFSSKIKLDYKNDPSLIGGLIVQVGSTMIDTSIKNKLQQIENKMVEA